MNLDVYRDIETQKSVTSKISVDGVFQFFGLEPSRLTPVHAGHPCIPAGTYAVTISHSPHLGYDTPEVMNVPGRSNIRIHIGNFPEDVLGCLAVGQTRNLPDFVGKSRIAFETLMPKLIYAIGRNESITITYHDPEIAV